MQGQLRKEYLKAYIESQCAHCGRAIEFELDSELDYHAPGELSHLRIFSPLVDISKIEDPSIIDKF